MPEQFPAHIRIHNGEREVQTVQEHCRNTAAIAGDTLSELLMQKTAYLAGLLHDAGKFTEEFKVYLEKAATGNAPKRGSVNHTFAGVRYLLNHYHTSKDEYDLSPIAAELLAYAVGAHHGLFDCVDEDGHSGFQHRLDKPHIHYKEAMKNFLAQCADQEELDQLFGQASKELSPVVNSLCDLAQQNDSYYGEASFYLGMLARLLLSAVIEGDRQDTASFMNGVKPPSLPEDRREMWNNCLARVEQKLREFSMDSPIAQARRAISEQCGDFGKQLGGVFRLNVPTGGGKTLGSLRFALAHAAEWNKAHIIFTSPLLSILDQNAQVLRDYIQDDSIVLEHHSNVVRAEKKGNEIIDGSDPELLTENWAAPIIITTLVQLLNTLFSGKTSCIRRFHALTNSIIVIDEVQTVPNRMLTLFNLAVNFLAQICGTTVVLCSATQPCFERADHPIRNTDPYLIRDIVPYDKELWEPFHRTKIIDAGSLTLQEIPDFMIEQLDTVNSLLVVCNKKSEAAFLYRELRERGYPCFHLSASMCMAHRRETLDEMNKALKKLKDALKNGRKIERECKIICIATQVIEAGVDISFQCVIRLTAGLDSIIQSAGRCNRNGEEPNLASVYTVQCKGEDLRMLSDIQRAQTATINLLKEFQNHPGDFQNDLSSDQAVSYFYRRLYREMPGKFQDYMTKDKPSLFSLLSENEDYVEGETGFELNQAFREAGKLFQVFDDESEDVIVPYKGGAECIANLCSEKASRDPDYLQRCLGQAKPYTIAIFSYQKKQLMAQNGLYEICGGKVLALKKEFYDDKALGFVTDGAQNNYLEVWTL